MSKVAGVGRVLVVGGRVVVCVGIGVAAAED